MNQVEAKRFADAIEAESYDEKIGLKHAGPPMNLGARKADPSIIKVQRMQGLLNKIVGMFRDRLSMANESEVLNTQITQRLGHGLPELIEKSKEEKLQTKEELLGVCHGLLDWLASDEVKSVDIVTASKLTASYERGKGDGFAQADKMYKAELERLKIGADPLTRSLNERLKG
jgi:hypothetical protein